jgi:RNA polymerase sigma factor (sigma-70 family)
MWPHTPSSQKHEAETGDMSRAAQLVAAPANDERSERFASFYADYRPRVRRYAFACFGPAYAEEIAQETMVRALACFEDFDLTRDPWPWLAVVTRNFGRDLVRRLERSELVDGDAFQMIPDSDWADPVNAAEEQERQRLIARTLDTLPVGDVCCC